MNDLSHLHLFVWALLATPSGAHTAERTDTTSKAFVYTASECPVTPKNAIESETGGKGFESIGPILGSLAATVAGNLVTAAANAASDALTEASNEQGFGVEGRSWYYSHRLIERTTSIKIARAIRLQTCIVLFTQDGQGVPLNDFPGLLKADDAINSELGQRGLSMPITDEIGSSTSIIDELRANGATREPALYIEARILSSEEGIIIRPVFVRYARPFSNAPREPREGNASELHVTLAVPGGNEAGTPFATARLMLPKIKSGQTVLWRDLRASSSVILSARPTTGRVMDSVSNANAAYSQQGIREIELKVAKRAFDEATSRSRAKPADLDLKLLKERAESAFADAQTALDGAAAVARAVKSQNVGATNVSMRYISVREPNKFGLTLAKALKGQAEALGKAASAGVTSAVTQQPEWSAGDTGFLIAQAALSAKQREYDAALASGETSMLAKLADELLVVKAKVNEAAVAIRRPIPYPSLFPSP